MDIYKFYVCGYIDYNFSFINLIYFLFLFLCSKAIFYVYINIYINIYNNNFVLFCNIN